MKKQDYTKLIVLVPVLAAAAAIIYLVFAAAGPENEFTTGIVEGKEIDLASKIPGRIEKLYVEEGASVNAGDTIAVMESKELAAKEGQAKSARKAAEQKMLMARRGARKQEIEAVRNLYLQAKHQYEYAENTWERFSKLYEDSVISRQKRDEIEFKYNAAKAQYEAAKSKYELVKEGARSEEKVAAEALYEQAQNAYAEVEAYMQELYLIAPQEGEVSSIIIDEGEIIAQGYPVATILVPDESSVVLRLREDKMKEIRKGNILVGNIPALGREAEFEVTYIAPLGDFATWKPTDQKGEFDLKSFEIKLKPVKSIEGLRPGMTVNFDLNAKG